MTPSPNSRAPVRRDARVTKSRHALHAALLELVAEMPFDQITVAAITTRAKVGYATFFRHYAGREALLADIAEGLTGELLTRMVPLLAAQDTRAAALALALFVEERRPFCRALLMGAGDATRREITARAIAAVGQADTALPSWLPRELGIVHGVAATLTILKWWVEQDQQQDASTIADIIDRLVLAPLAA